MTIHIEDTIETGTADRIRRIREAFADSRDEGAPEDLVVNFDETEFDEIVP